MILEEAELAGFLYGKVSSHFGKAGSSLQAPQSLPLISAVELQKIVTLL
ncbi:hypothetical protein HGP05_09650 [Streptococcus sanguinis]|uniref:Uncharacterized protein n=1 Tax=Streptococcus sanguinis TaxID=1305 RepID=A0A7Y0VBI5_STRSA|nr:hypothetical protein [Streptococcus sanguinis]